MGLRIEKVRTELRTLKAAVQDNLHEILVTNRPRYKDPSEWVHLAMDPFVSLWSIIGAFASMSYTLGHLTVVILLIALIEAIFA